MNDSDIEEGWERIFDDRLAMAVLLMFAYAALQLAAAFLMTVFANIWGWGETQFYAATTLSLLAVQAFCLILVWRNLHAEGGVPPGTVGVRHSAIKPMRAVALVLLLAALMLGLERLYETLTGYEGQTVIRQWLEATVAAGGGMQGMTALAVVVGAPLVEEFIFRGYLQSALMGRIPAAVAVGASALIFAAFHMDAQAFPLLFAGGLMLGSLYHLTRSLWPPVLLHMLVNLHGLVDVFQN